MRNGEGYIVSELKLKTAHWACLPWKLAGLASDDCEAVHRCGRDVLLLYDAMTQAADASFAPAAQRPMTKCPQVEKFLEGEDRRNLPELRCWLGALRLQRCNGRDAEARSWHQCDFKNLQGLS